MSDTIINLKTIPPGSKMTVEIDTDLYIRLQQCLLEALPFKDEKELMSIIQEVTKGTPTEGLAYHAHTLIHLLFLIEEAAKQQNILKPRQFDTALKQLID